MSKDGRENEIVIRSRQKLEVSRLDIEVSVLKEYQPKSENLEKPERLYGNDGGFGIGFD